MLFMIFLFSTGDLKQGIMLNPYSEFNITICIYLNMYCKCYAAITVNNKKNPKWQPKCEFTCHISSKILLILSN